jgi:type IV secretion system protein VirB1
MVIELATVLALAARPDCGASHGIEASRLAAIAQQESGRDPLAIGINGPGGGDLHPKTVAEAVATVRRLLAAGKSVDLGLMQINAANLAMHKLTVESAFDACASLRAGAEHLAADLERAQRMYNCGRPDCGVAYAEKIRRIQSQMTGQARASAPADSAPLPNPYAAPIIAYQRFPQLETLVR